MGTSHSPLSTHLEDVAADGAGGLVAGAEPAVEAGAVELLLARLAGELGQLVRVLVDDAVAHVALLDALELLVQVALPQRQSVEDGAVLVAEEEVELHEHLLGLDAAVDALAALHLGHGQRVVEGQRDHQLHARLLLGVHGHDLARGVVHADLDVVHALALVDEGAQLLLAQQRRGVEHVELLDEQVGAVGQVGPAFTHNGWGGGGGIYLLLLLIATTQLNQRQRQHSNQVLSNVGNV